MSFYILLWGSLLLLFLWQERVKAKIPSFVLWSVLILLSVFIVGCRYQVGNDWESYKIFYYNGYAYDKSTGAMEPLFTLIRNICFSLGLSHGAFFAILSLFSFSLLVKTSETFQLRNIYFVLFAYLSLFFCSFQFNIVRQGLLSACIWYAFSEKSVGHAYRALLWVIIGCGFHISGLLFIPILFFVDRKLPAILALIIIGGAYVCFFLNVSDKLISFFPFLQNMERAASYLNSSTDGYGLSIGMIFNTVLLVYSYKFLNIEYEKNVKLRILMNSLLLALVMTCLFNSFYTLVSRIANVLNMALVFFWPMFVLSFRKVYFRFGVKCCMMVYMFLYFNISINTKSDTTSMLPYKMRTEQLYRRMW